ncbi:MAG: nucleotide sugar dehydrogenase [Candidatus Omnitrophota bacterium]|nr:nucleotide sugar dehydrogenase [Candidatus Omnitrophota bacterium]
MELKRISLAGLGRLGSPMTAALASKGFPVIGLDADPLRTAGLNKGLTPVYEPGLQKLVSAHKEKLSGTQDYSHAVQNSDATFLVVPTPSEPDGGFSLKHVLDAGGRIGDALRNKEGWHLVILTSTVMPGSTGNVLRPLLEARSGKKCGRDFGLCYNPEFIALGSVIRDFLNPDLVLIGESDPEAGRVLEGLYAKVCDNKPSVVRMSFVNAELTKLSINTFVTTKITFANTLARICENLPGADVDVVTSALGRDSRIGAKYLKGAVGYGGPCFPRDNLALAKLARKLNTPSLLADATDQFNRQQVRWLADLIKRHLPPQGVAGILGLAYKPDSDVVEESQGLLLAQILAADGVSVAAYDPIAMENARGVLGKGVRLVSSAEECIRASDVVAVATAWKEFEKIPPAVFARAGGTRTVVDCWRQFPQMEGQAGIRYLPLGIGRC